MAYEHGKTYYIIPEGAVTNRSNVLTKNERPVALNLEGLTPVVGYSNNRNVNLWSIDYTTDMKWYLEIPRNAGYARLHCRGKPSFGLDYYYGSSNPGNCDIYKIAGNEEDSKINFRTISAGENRYRIQCYRNNSDNDLYLTATGFTNGSDVRWQPLDYSKNSQQIWWLVPVDEVMTPNQVKKDIIDNVCGAFGNFFTLDTSFVYAAVTENYSLAAKTITTDDAYITATLKYKGELSNPSFTDRITYTVAHDTDGSITVSSSNQNVTFSSELDVYLPKNVELTDVVKSIALDLGVGDYTVSMSVGTSLKNCTLEILRNIYSLPDNPEITFEASVVFTLYIDFRNTSKYNFKNVALIVVGVPVAVYFVYQLYSLGIGFILNYDAWMKALLSLPRLGQLVERH